MVRRINGEKKRECRRVPRFPFLLSLSLLWLLLVIPSSLRAHSVVELASKPEMFNQQAVTVVGEISDVVTRYGEKPYTTFLLSGEENARLPIFVWGTPTFKQGHVCQVAGTFVTEKALGAYALKSGIEAREVKRISDAELRAGSTIFKKKKKVGIRGARGFYIPQ